MSRQIIILHLLLTTVLYTQFSKNSLVYHGSWAKLCDSFYKRIIRNVAGLGFISAKTGDEVVGVGGHRQYKIFFG